MVRFDQRLYSQDMAIINFPYAYIPIPPPRSRKCCSIHGTRERRGDHLRDGPRQGLREAEAEVERAQRQRRVGAAADDREQHRRELRADPELPPVEGVAEEPRDLGQEEAAGGLDGGGEREGLHLGVK